MLETLNAVFMFMQMYHYLIIGFGRLDIIEKVHWYIHPIVQLHHDTDIKHALGRLL